MYKIIPFKKEHLECMEQKPNEFDIYKSGFIDIAAQGDAITGMIDGRIITCGGIMFDCNYNGIIWQIPSVHVAEVSREYARAVRRWVDDMQELYLVKRMETNCLNDDFHNRWMRFLGFQSEGIKRQWCNGEDYVMWSRLWE